MTKKYKISNDVNDQLVNDQPMMYAISSSMVSINSLTSSQKMNIVRSGVSKAYLQNLKTKIGLDYDMLAKALSVTRATLINKKSNAVFSHKISEKIVALADVYSYGYEVFEDEGHFNQWMLSPNTALDGNTPISYLDNLFGREEVKSLIGRIAHGVFS